MNARKKEEAGLLYLVRVSRKSEGSLVSSHVPAMQTITSCGSQQQGAPALHSHHCSAVSGTFSQTYTQAAVLMQTLNDLMLDYCNVSDLHPGSSVDAYFE